MKEKNWRVADKRTLQGNFMIMPVGSGGAVARVYDEANAQLIASAPDLYEALKEAQMIIARAELAKGNIHRLAIEERMIKALAKAEEGK